MRDDLEPIHVECRASLGPTTAGKLIKVIAGTHAGEGVGYD